MQLMHSSLKVETGHKKKGLINFLQIETLVHEKVKNFRKVSDLAGK